MTQEEKKDLLLKDIISRIPYRVQVNHKTYGDYTIYGVCESYAFGKNKFGGAELLVDAVKPYLFPLKSVDETLRNEFYTLYDKELDYVLAEDIGATWDKSMDEFEVKEHKLEIKNLLLNSYSKILRWCYKNHIDVNGLIEKGLAIDATGKNIY